MKVKDAYEAINAVAPFSTALDWDNSGLQVGDMNAPLTGVLTALDVTMPVLEEAEKAGFNLIVSHHPVLFRAVKHFTAGDLAYEAARRGISIISAHTNFDMAGGGVNAALADALDLNDRVPLHCETRESWKKVSVFVPKSHAERLYSALSEIGCGAQGDYSGCAFLTSGEGRFKPETGAEPYLGEVGRETRVPEIRLEMIFPPRLQRRVIDTIRRVHPYEEPAFDIFTTDGIASECWLGMVGYLPEPMDEESFAELIARRLGVLPRYNPGHRMIQKVGVVGGAGGEYAALALREGHQIDAFVTSEVKHHQFLEAESLGITLYDASHYGTEAVAVPCFTALLSEALDVPVRAATAYDGRIAN